MNDHAIMLGWAWAKATTVPWILITAPAAIAVFSWAFTVGMRWLKRATGNDWLNDKRDRG